jgi:hypothetical protein
MRDVFYIEPSNDHPKVVLDKVNNTFEITGKSLPEDVNEFYDPIVAWIREYAKNPNPETVFVLNLEYYNSATVRKIVDILVVLESMHKAGKIVKVRWIFEESDEMMGENGEDFMHTVNIPFEITSYRQDD